MLTHDGWRLQTNRAVTQSSALGTASYDTNVLGHNLLALYGFLRWPVFAALPFNSTKIASKG
jgi:hypothetical protein